MQPRTPMLPTVAHRCPSCGVVLKAPADAAGKLVKCRSCASKFRLPVSSAGRPAPASTVSVPAAAARPAPSRPSAPVVGNAPPRPASGSSTEFSFPLYCLVHENGRVPTFLDADGRVWFLLFTRRSGVEPWMELAEPGSQVPAADRLDPLVRFAELNRGAGFVLNPLPDGRCEAVLPLEQAAALQQTATDGDGDPDGDLPTIRLPGGGRVRLNRPVDGSFTTLRAVDFLQPAETPAEQPTVMLMRALTGGGPRGEPIVPDRKTGKPPAAPGADRPAGPDTAARFPAVAGYEILGELGRGGMGVVYKARQTDLGRMTALKMILGGAAAGEEELARFSLEAQAVARIQHPNIVQVYEIGRHDGLPYFSLEFVDGGSLAQQMGKPFDPRRAAELTMTLARAVHAAHQRNIVHRDLKPANILLTAEGVPKIADFGLAKRIDDDSVRTKTGAVMGTPSYMAPEQAQGNVHEVGPPADVYALGSILYDMLTGRPPFRGNSALETLFQVVSVEPVPPSKLERGVPRDLETICLKCLEKNPAARYASADALAEDLRRFLADEPILARPGGTWERVIKWTRRRPTAAALAGVSIAAAVALVVLGVRYNRALEAALLDADTQRDRAESALRDTEAARKDERAARELAEQRELTVRRRSYAAGMNLAFQAFGVGRVDRATALLNEQRPPPAGSDLRGFEWHCLWNLCNTQRHILRGHTDKVWCVAFSPQERLLASGGADGAVRLWDPETGVPRTALTGHTGTVLALAFSPDGRTLASSANDRTVRLWDVAEGRQKLVIEGNAARIGALAFSPDGTMLAGGGNEKLVKLWNPADGRLLHSLSGHGGTIRSVVFLRNGGLLATSSEDKTICLWNAVTGEKTGDPLSVSHDVVTGIAVTPDGKTLVSSGGVDQTLKLYRLGPPLREEPAGGVDLNVGYINGVAVSPDGSTIAVACETRNTPGTVVLVDRRTGDVRRTLRGHVDGVTAVAFSADGARLASASLDHTVRVWDVQTEPGWTPPYRGHTNKVQSLAVSPDGATIASIGWDATIKLWSSRTGELRREFPGSGGIPGAVAYAPDGTMLAVAGAGDSTLRLLSAADGRPTASVTLPGPAVSVAFAPDGSVLAVGAGDGVHILSFPDLSERLVLKGHDPAALAAVFSPDGSRLATASVTGVIRFWKMPEGTEVADLRGHTGDVRALAFSPDGKTLVSGGGQDRTLRLWDAATGKSAGRLEGHEFPITSIAFSPDGSTLYSTGGHFLQRRGELRVWNLRAGTGYNFFSGRVNYFSKVAVLPDGSGLVTANHDRSVRVFDPATGSQRFIAGGGPLLSAAFAPDGATVALARGRGIVLLDARTGRLLSEFDAHEVAVRSVALSADGNIVATCAEDGLVRLRDRRSGQVRELRGHTGPVWAVAFSPDASLVASAGRDKTVRIWDVATGAPRTLLPGHSFDVTALAFSADGKHLLSGCGDIWPNLPGEARLWMLDGNDRTGKVFEGHGGPIRTVAFRRDGAQFATAGDDMIVLLRRTADGAVLATLQGHTAYVRCAVFSPDGSRLFTGAGDSTVRVWDMQTFQELGAIRLGHSVDCLAISPDGRTLVAGTNGNDGRSEAVFLRADVRADAAAEPPRNAAGG